MRQMTEELKQLYRDKEKLELRKLLFVSEFENQLRSRRVVTTEQEQNLLYIEHGALSLNEINLKSTKEIYDKPLNDQELKAWKEFESLLKLVDSFQVLPEDQDIEKILNKLNKPNKGELTFSQLWKPANIVNQK